MIVVLDNQDSFVFNLARYFVLLGSEVKVLSSHETSLEDIESTKPKALVISPGPCTPKKAGVSIACVRKFRGRVPLLGVCLGHQVIVEALGGVIRMSNEPRHGRMSRIYHERTDLFSGISNPMSACRDHSLVVEESGIIIIIIAPALLPGYHYVLPSFLFGMFLLCFATLFLSLLLIVS